MRKAISMIGKAIGVIGKLLLVGALLIGNFIMNCIGTLICAISSN